MTDVPVDKEFWNGLLRQVARRTQRPADAEDLLHAAYLRFTNYKKKHAVENVATFLIRSAVNICIDNYRRDRLLAGIAPEDVCECKNYPLQDEVLATRARLERVKAGLLKLTPRTREVFLMHRLENLKYREIANRLEMSESAVEKHVAKAALFLTAWTEGW